MARPSATTRLPADGGGHVPSHHLLPSILTSIVVVAEWIEIAPGVGPQMIMMMMMVTLMTIIDENYDGDDHDDDADDRKEKPKASNREPSNRKHNSTPAFSATP